VQLSSPMWKLTVGMFEKPEERSREHMLAGVLLHVITTAHGVNAALNRRSFGNRLGGVMKRCGPRLHQPLRPRHFPFVREDEQACIVHLPATGGINAVRSSTMACLPSRSTDSTTRASKS